MSGVRHIRDPYVIAAIVGLLLVVFNTSASATDDRAEAERHAKLGLQLAQKGDLARAEQELRQAGKLAPADSDILTSLGTVLSMQKKLEEASSVFKKALAISPRDMTARRYLAANLWQLKRFPEARQNLQILLKEKPEDQSARLLLGMVSENMKDYATAAAMLASVPEQVRQQPESIAALARSYYHLDEREKARATLAQLADHPSGVQAIFLGAQISDEMHDYETAESLLISISSKYPDRVTLDYRVATVQYHAGKFLECQRTLLSLVERGQSSGQVYNLLGWTYFKMNQPEPAVQALNHAVDLAPQDETNYRDLGQMLIAGGSLPAALVLARKATAQFPGSAPAFELEGSVETRMGQFSDAIRSYSRAVELDPSRVEGSLGLAEAQASAGNKKEATAILDDAVRRFSGDARVKTLYASVLLKDAYTGDTQANRQAEGLLRRALALDRSLPAAHYELGKLALNEGRVAEAIAHMKQAVALDPQSSSAHFSLARAYRRAGQKEKAAQEMNLYENLKVKENPPSEAPALTPVTQNPF